MKERGARDVSSLLVYSAVFFREPLADEVPMPGITPDPGAGILQWLELQPAFRQTHCASIPDQPFSVRRDEVRHFAPLPHMTVQPQATVHGVDHPLATLHELDVVYGAC